MTRTPLHTRRQNETFNVVHDGHPFTVTVGYDDAGAPMEVFADGLRIGSDMAHTLADACVVISLALQHGCPAADLLKTLGQVPAPWMGEEATKPASVLGVIGGLVAVAVAPWTGIGDAPR